MARNVSDTWRLDHPWAHLYSFGMARRSLARAAGVIGFGTTFQGLYDAIDSLAYTPRGGTVLDVPCGAGIALAGINRQTRVRYLACDISPAMLVRTREAAARLGVPIETLEADVASLPLADRSVDVTVSLTGLHCFPDPHAAIREIARVTDDRIELTWLRADAGTRYRPVIAAGRAAGLIGPSATLLEVTDWLSAAGFLAYGVTEGAFAYVSARRCS
ncbi:class I SAM-dependent methyltransferase [Nocardioides sp. Kera G14]|uniref:class I SAM-dependent methyltransferase n=1 Tax=Nocardioides sp. Kera G14 TaxID=2884264 RepID=UPI001D0FD2A7|nr:class I SAM-dependent methyltransferase [Nocardioides sp. Kera G14]UDY24785.1 class I SAM-dependent methyltransferase [Nocardioides sp. Kera G14]